MKKTILKYGSYGLLTGLALFLAALGLGSEMSYAAQEVLGYITILACLMFIYFGIKHYRDKVNDGHVTFGRALGIGISIAVLVGLGFAIADYIYTSVINPDFMTEYSDYMLKSMEKSLSAEEFAVKKAELEEQMESMGSSSALAFIMFSTVVILGFLVSLISGLILQRKN